MPAKMPVRQPGRPHRPPQVAVQVQRTIDPRPDLQGYPTMVVDTLMMDDDDYARQLQCACLYGLGHPVEPLAPVVSYPFPYARSSRGQIVWKRALVRTRPMRGPHAC